MRTSPVATGYAPVGERTKQPMVPPLSISGVPALDPNLTPRSAAAAVDRAVNDMEALATKAAESAENAREAQLTARVEANAAADAARLAVQRAVACGASAPGFECAQQAAEEAQATAAATAAAAADAERAAQLTTRKAAIEASMVAASVGTYVLVTAGKNTEKFDSVERARSEAASLWMPWILYHEQRGCFSELTSGGVALPFAHASIRRHVSEVMQARINHVYGLNY